MWHSFCLRLVSNKRKSDKILSERKIIWLSANRFGYELLKEAVKIKHLNIIGIITLSKNATTVMYDGIENEKWNEFGIKVYEIERINHEKNLLNNLSPEFIIMAGWRQIINKEILYIPNNGFIGFHPTLLPIGRGPAPIINSIIQEFTESGVTMYYVSEGLDDGDIIAQEKFSINENDYASDLYEKIIIAGKKLIRGYLPLLIKGKAPRDPQDESKATRFKKRKLKENEIDIANESIHEIYNKIRALSKPYKGAYIQKDGKKLIIWKAEIRE